MDQVIVWYLEVELPKGVNVASVAAVVVAAAVAVVVVAVAVVAVVARCSLLSEKMLSAFCSDHPINSAFQKFNGIYDSVGMVLPMAVVTVGCYCC